MFKKICFINSLVFLVLSSNVVLAQNANTNEAIKVGYISFLKLVNSVPQAKQAEKRLETEFEPRRNKIEGLDKELKLEASELEKNAVVMTDADKTTKERELRAKNRELKLLYQEYQEDLTLRQNQETSVIQKLVYQAVIEIAKAENYDLILEQGTVYASPKIDITDKVLEKLTKQSIEKK